jgi:hypothetical protein
MSCLTATFTLTPQSPSSNLYGLASWAAMACYGGDFYPEPPQDLPSLYTSNRYFFDQSVASDPNLDYSKWINRQKARYIECVFDLSVIGAQKQLALIFGFDLDGGPARVLVYSDAGRIQDVNLAPGDNQFLIEFDSLDQSTNLYFIHAGGSWYFRGISGYLV